MATAKRWAYYFGFGKADGRGDQRELLGGKGAGLAEMTRIGLPVPCGFTITTNACADFHARKNRWPAGLDKQVRSMIAKMERATKKKLGGAKNPLLVSVRSGAAKSMPGMMDTILNLGLNDQSVEALAKASGNRRFAFDSYRRLIMMYGATAKGIDIALFEDAFGELKNNQARARMGLENSAEVVDTDVNADELQELVETFKSIYEQHANEAFPQNAFQQLKGAIDAVFDSWMAPKAITYRRVENITGLNGTAVNICQMVFGNMGDDCGTGVCFTRDPSTGEPCFYGDALINAQGEDVVAGIRTPFKLEELKKLMPEAYQQLLAVRAMLEVHYKEMQDLEFTIEQGTLYMLQCRTGKRSPEAAFRIAVDQATKGLMTSAAAKSLVKKKYLPKQYANAATKPVITKDEAIQRIVAADVERLFHPVLDPETPADELAERRLGAGIGAVPGAAVGEIAFTADHAEVRAADGATVILVRKETSPEDVGGMHVSAGILTATGGKTSHAAVVARGWGKCCIVGCDELRLDFDAKTMTMGSRTLHEGDTISLDGSSGEVFEGEIGLVKRTAPPEFSTLMKWCDQRRRLKVRANADTPQDAIQAVSLGAEGIGLCRTEHMFFDPSQPERITAMRQMILANNEADRRRALDKLLPFQQQDFEGLFKAMSGKPVTIRLLDPPLHEFLPQNDNPQGQRDVADELNADLQQDGISGRDVTVDDISRRVDQLHESNPMLGHRGCRLCVTYPEILEMQVRAIMEAAVSCSKNGVKVHPEIMIPLSIDDRELGLLVSRTKAVADGVLKANGRKVKYLVGTMVETPRAALLASRMAGVAEFFSFGTNDLTQMTMGLSRDDAGRFLPAYLEPSPTCGEPADGDAAILPFDPFDSLDTDGVGLLVQMACDGGRSTRRDIKLGICGEHGGDPSSILFCEAVGLDYVSCSPFRVPVARLAAAQAVIGAPKFGGRIVKTNSKSKADIRPTKAKAKTARKTKKKTTRGVKARGKVAKRSRA